MSRKLYQFVCLFVISFHGLAFSQHKAIDQVHVEGGTLAQSPESSADLHIFKGVPYAAPPIGDLRWRPPQAVPSWSGVRAANDFAARCMQPNIYDDLRFRDKGMSEDCLYLNVWTPAASPKEHLPVMVWIHGGGFSAGSSSEPRHDGASLAKKGVIVVTVNYRLGIFGFFSHPELTQESGHHASGNYGLLDQVAALHWIRKNIAAFGGDPNNVTIFGESAGSISVSLLMASPLAHGLFQRAIGESGGMARADLKPNAESAILGKRLASYLGADSVAALRARSADDLLKALANLPADLFPAIRVNVDEYFLSQQPATIFAQGRQSHVPLLVGWNAEEGKATVLFYKQKPTVQSFTERAKKQFGDHADEFLKLYPATSDEQATKSAEDFEGDLFILFGTWKWMQLHSETGHSSIYHYVFDRVPAVVPGTLVNGVPEEALGARHSGEIEYVFGTLSWMDAPWKPEDRKLSNEMENYWTNFARTGNPNAPGLPDWPTYTPSDGYQVMHLAAESHIAPEVHRDRYKFLEAHWPSPE